jgi:hypothetical protein
VIDPTAIWRWDFFIHAPHGARMSFAAAVAPERSCLLRSLNISAWRSFVEHGEAIARATRSLVQEEIGTTMTKQPTRVHLESDILKSDPGCDGIIPTGVVMAAVSGDSGTNFPQEKPRTITHTNLSSLAGYAPTLNFKVANKLGAGGEQLPVSVKLTRGTEHWLADIVEQNDELRLLKDRLDALVDFRKRLPTRTGRITQLRLLQVIEDLRSGHATNHGETHVVAQVQ